MTDTRNATNEDPGQELAAFSRANLTDHIELRVQVPAHLIGVIDAEVMSRGGEAANVYRATIVREVLSPWAEKKLHDATVLLRLVGSKPTGSEVK